MRGWRGDRDLLMLAPSAMPSGAVFLRLLPKNVTAYQVKRSLLSPYIWGMRIKEGNTSRTAKPWLEQFHYMPAIYRFRRSIRGNPDLLCEAPNVDSKSVVFDVGAYVGDWAATIAEKYGPQIYCFEVDPDLCKSIAARFESQPKIQCFDYGLGNRNANLLLNRNGWGSTFYADGAPEKRETVDAAIRDVVEVMDELKIRQIDWMKVNIEGGEYDLLERMIEADRLRDVVCLSVQFHEWLDGAWTRRRGIRKALRKTHQLRWDYPFIWEQWLRK
jgi:FkbM family methyltransferase